MKNNTATLATKYRPNTWDDVIGADTTVNILKRQIETNTTVSCYLFAGNSGCGKTTLMRIFANELNHGNGSPIQIDAASNNSVDTIRQIKADAQQRSLNSEYKVIAFDEAHALTNQSWQALLKLIEEPPKYTKFIFCTTNPEKIPDTILSRVQTYTFNKVPDNLLIDRLKYVISCENNELGNIYTYNDEALACIVRMSNGSVRQSIANLEKCLAYNHSLSVESVVESLGSGDYAIMNKLLYYMFSKDIQNSLALLDDVYSMGKDIKSFAFNLLKYQLDLFKVSLSGYKCTNIVQSDATDYLLSNYSNEFNLGVKFLSNTYEKLKYDDNPIIIFESEFVKWCMK